MTVFAQAQPRSPLPPKDAHIHSHSHPHSHPVKCQSHNPPFSPATDQPHRNAGQIPSLSFPSTPCSSPRLTLPLLPISLFIWRDLTSFIHSFIHSRLFPPSPPFPVSQWSGERKKERKQEKARNSWDPKRERTSIDYERRKSHPLAACCGRREQRAVAQFIHLLGEPQQHCWDWNAG